LRGGESDAAIADYTAALATKPQDAPSLYGRGAAHAAKAEMDAASKDIAAARAADPKIDALMARLHVTAAGAPAPAAGAGQPTAGSATTGETATATDAAGETAALDDKTLCSGRKQAPLPEEVAACTRLLQGNLSPADQAWAYSRRGTAYTDQRDFDHAIQDYSTAIGISPDQAYAYSGRGLAYYYKGSLDQAIADQDAALKLMPTFSGAFGARGYAHLKAGDSAAAHDDFDSALKARPDQAIWLFGRATAAAALGQQAEAQADLDAAHKLDPRVESTVQDLFDFKPATP
jgi:tetratricopeptide (TPR) repeat protein